MGRTLCWVALLVTCAACSRSVHTDPPASPAQGVAPPRVAATAPAAGSPVVGVAAGEAPAVAAGLPIVGPPRTFANLTVFPILSRTHEDIGPITTLDAALGAGTAHVHEIGAGTGPNADGAQVNSLVIDNAGSVPVYVLAGTIVKGGKQDRQIGQDFIVGAHQTVPVDAYCVEHGRWTLSRDGVATAGQFGTIGLLTESRVRTAAEHDKDQGEVWAKVAQVNEANKKEAASGTLLATVDSADIVAQRAALTEKVEGYVAEVQPSADVVGFAYAVDGKVRSIRWFVDRKVFLMFEGVLAGTAAMEAITSQAETKAGGKPPPPAAPLTQADVTKFVADVQKGAVKETRSTPGLNDNTMRESKEGYGASTTFKPSAAQPSAPPKPVSTSITSF
ncbi:MAG TPA: DUF6569 family protein [Polyangiaceae bacterium]|jgi:hypothetical protein